jgi:hypothetical protein
LGTARATRPSLGFASLRARFARLQDMRSEIQQGRSAAAQRGEAERSSRTPGSLRASLAKLAA